LVKIAPILSVNYMNIMNSSQYDASNR